MCKMKIYKGKSVVKGKQQIRDAFIMESEENRCGGSLLQSSGEEKQSQLQTLALSFSRSVMSDSL